MFLRSGPVLAVPADDWGCTASLVPRSGTPALGPTRGANADPPAARGGVGALRFRCCRICSRSSGGIPVSDGGGMKVPRWPLSLRGVLGCCGSGVLASMSSRSSGRRRRWFNSLRYATVRGESPIATVGGAGSLCRLFAASAMAQSSLSSSEMGASLQSSPCAVGGARRGAMVTGSGWAGGRAVLSCRPARGAALLSGLSVSPLRWFAASLLSARAGPPSAPPLPAAAPRAPAHSRAAPKPAGCLAVALPSPSGRSGT